MDSTIITAQIRKVRLALQKKLISVMVETHFCDIEGCSGLAHVVWLPTEKGRRRIVRCKRHLREMLKLLETKLGQTEQRSLTRYMGGSE